MYAVIDQFKHFLMISFEHGEPRVTKLSSGDVSRVHEHPRFIVIDRDKLHFLTSEIEYGIGFAGRDFTWTPM
jgi:hypothetical protein